MTLLLLYVDSCAWRIVRLPLAPFYMTQPFLISALLVACIGYVCVPLMRSLKAHQIINGGAPIKHHKKKQTPTMGGLFFIPTGVIVARSIAGKSSVEVTGAAVATLAFALIGLLDDLLSIKKKQNSGLSGWIRISLEVFFSVYPYISVFSFLLLLFLAPEDTSLANTNLSHRTGGSGYLLFTVVG